jgi:hypothetical protein
MLELDDFRQKQTHVTFVMAGLDPAIDDFEMMVISKSWMPATRAGMTADGDICLEILITD